MHEIYRGIKKTEDREAKDMEQEGEDDGTQSET